jgi:hypothetical protein
VKARKVEKLEPSGAFDLNAARIIDTRLAELRSFLPEALAPGVVDAQHGMRIAAKRLRYLLELTGLCFGEPAERARRGARELQDVLGEIHDCDVMLPRAQAEIERLRADDARALLLLASDAEDLDSVLTTEAPNLGAYRGLELLAVHLRARRALLFERFCQLWRAQVDAGTWSELQRAIDRRLASPGSEAELRSLDRPDAQQPGEHASRRAS